MLSINLPSGPPAGPATPAGAARRAGDDGSVPEGFEGLLAGLLVPPAPPPGALPVADLAAARTAPPPVEVPADGPAEGGDAVPGDAETPPQGGRPGPVFGFGLPATEADAAPAAGMPGQPQPQAAKAPDPGPAPRPPAAPAAAQPAVAAAQPAVAAAQPAVAAAQPAVAPAQPAASDPPPARVDRTARREGAGAVAVEPPVGHRVAERPGLRATIGPAAARPTGRADATRALLTAGPIGPVDDYRAADDSLAWRGLLAVDGSSTFAGPPLEAAGSAEAPLAASAVRQLALAIGRAVSGDVRQLSVQLSPEELGGLEITVDFADERRVAVTILAERPETLDLLRGETRQLERLLGQQGVSLAGSGFELGLMADGRGQRREHAGAGPGQRSSIDLADPTDAAPPVTAAAPSARRGLLNLSV